MAKIVFFEIEKWEEDYLKRSFGEQELVLTEDALEASNAKQYSDAEIVSVFVYSNVSKEVLELLPNLKFITTRSMGYDHIDLDYCKENGIKASYIPSYGSHTVAEHTFTLILAISRKLVESVERARKGDFSSENLTGFDLFGKTLGVVGTGHIGANVCELGLSFGMKVLAYNHHEDSDLVNKGIKYLSLEELLASSDIITLHLPHTKETEHIINMQNIEKFKKGAVLINTARGALVETQAIVYGLENKILSGAGLDVLEEEKVIREESEFLSKKFIENMDYKTDLMNHVLLQREDVVITPHNAFNSKEALEEILEQTTANINSYIKGAPVNLIGE